MLLLMYIGFLVLFFVMMIVNFVGNMLVILVVLRNRFMKIFINYLLVNLVSVDMVVVIFIGIQFIVILIFIYFQGIIGFVLCKIIIGGILGWVGVVVFVFFLVVIVIECYWVVLYFYSQKIKFIKIKIIIFVMLFWIVFIIWVILGFWVIIYIKEINGCVYSFLKFIYVKLYIVGWFVVVGVIFISIMGVLYFRVVY